MGAQVGFCMQCNQACEARSLPAEIARPMGVCVHIYVIIIIIVTGLESHTKCASRAHVVRLHVP
jgi:hypothetical protein